MKFRLPRQVISADVKKIIDREVKKQKLAVLRASSRHLQQLAKVSQLIIKDGLPKYLVRRKLPHQLGHGIFLHPRSKPLVKGQMVAFYSGKTVILPQNKPDNALYSFEPIADMTLFKEEQRYWDPSSVYRPTRLYSLQVDALKTGNFTRFINHSDQPNVIAELVRIPKNQYGLSPSTLEVVYLVKKTIRPGEQLLVCYDGDAHSYWRALDIKPFPLLPDTFHLIANKNTIQMVSTL